MSMTNYQKAREQINEILYDMLNQGIKNLGKPPTLQDVVRVLNIRNGDKMGDRVYGVLGDELGYYTTHVDDTFDSIIHLDLSKQPSEWSEEVWGKLLELME